MGEFSVAPTPSLHPVALASCLSPLATVAEEQQAPPLELPEEEPVLLYSHTVPVNSEAQVLGH